MRERSHTFEDLPFPEVTLDLEWDYYFDPGRYYGRPEDCYPEEEDCQVSLPDRWEEDVINEYMKAASLAVKEIKARVKLMEDSFEPREWADELADRGGDL